MSGMSGSGASYGAGAGGSVGSQQAGLGGILERLNFSTGANDPNMTRYNPAAQYLPQSSAQPVQKDTQQPQLNLADFLKRLF